MMTNLTIFDDYGSMPESEIRAIIGSSKFKQTLTVWNRFNRTSTIGQCLWLYKTLEASNPADFMTRYFASGKQLQEQLLTASTDEKKQLKAQHGRTPEALEALAYRFHQALKLPDYSLEDARCYLWIRIFYQTHIGAQREASTFASLQALFPTYQLQEVEANQDTHYGIDAELYENDRLLCGLQIKPETYYFGQSPSTQSAKYQNYEKHQRYANLFQVPVCYVISTEQGLILKIFTSAEPQVFKLLHFEHPDLERYNPLIPKRSA